MFMARMISKCTGRDSVAKVSAGMDSNYKYGAEIKVFVILCRSMATQQ